jgi:hypothetical protein
VIKKRCSSLNDKPERKAEIEEGRGMKQRKNTTSKGKTGRDGEKRQGTRQK